MDRKTIEDHHLPSMVLMEHAALRVGEEIEKREGNLSGKSIIVIAGKGNNGGDGIAVARLLSTRCSANITVWLAVDRQSLVGDCSQQYEIGHSYGLKYVDIAQQSNDERNAQLTQADLVVDALFGTGFRGSPDEGASALIDGINRSGCRVCAVDLPSGIDAETGRVPGEAVQATYTVTFACAKFGMLQYPAATFVGELIVADIGMPRSVMAITDAVFIPEASDIGRLVPARVPVRDSNKGRYGNVAVIAGSRGMIGAACMSSLAAVKTGAGLVSIMAPDSVVGPLMSNAAWSIMVRGLAESEGGSIDLSALDAALEFAAKSTACVIGPGMGGLGDASTLRFVTEFVARCPVPLVIDADAITMLASMPDRGAGLVSARTQATVLTPHPGEMGRLMGCDTAAVQEDRRSAVTQTAANFGCTILLKGARTLVADQSGHLSINTTSNAGMATGGSGDVLSGVVGTLLGQGVGAFEAAYCGAYLHGVAGDIATAKNGSESGLAAPEIIECLPAAIGRCQQSIKE